MLGRLSRGFVRILVASLAVSFLAFTAVAQDDPDPNSPTPILISENGSTRALAVDGDAFAQTSVDLSRTASRAFAPGGKVVLFLTNVNLMKDEGATAFRVYARDARGHMFRFPVLNFEKSEYSRNLYALTIEMRDEVGYWEAPTPDGDLAIYVTWRGLASNTVQLGFGEMGDGVGEIPNAAPTPIGTTGAKLSVSAKSSKPSKKGQTSLASPDFVGYRWSGDRARFLEQATFGQTMALDTRIRRIGLRTWLSEQFSAPYPSATNPYPNQPLKTTNQGADPTCDGQDATAGNAPDVPTTCVRDTYSMYQPQAWFFREAFYGDAQLRHRVSWSLAQIWVTSGVDVQQGRHMVEYHKILSKNAFGNYRNLMAEMTLNPAMGSYLDMAGSTRTNPNENYARELMQLFSVGLFMLNADGTLQLDGQGNPIPTYDQTGVNNLTKVLTGWNACSVGPPTCPNGTVGITNYIDPMIITNTGNHDLTAKSLLTYPGATGTSIAACSGCNAAAIQTYASASMNTALDNIYNHPNVAPFVSKLLIQHLVTSDPTPAYVGRIAAVFNANRTNPTQMKEVITAILLDPEARGDTKSDPNFGKLREPVQLATNILRLFDVQSANRTLQSDGVIFQRGEFTGMSQIPFRSPTVFNFYPPDYVVPGLAILGPEFALMTTGTSVQRLNFANQNIFNNASVTVALPDRPNGTSIDFSEMQAIAAFDTTCNYLVDELNRRMLHGTMSPTMRSNILTAVLAVPSSDPLTRARQAMYLIATSSQYQVQR